MSNNEKKLRQLYKLTKWIQKYPAWWYLICTPTDEHMNPEIMITLIEQLEKEEFYQIIIFLLMVHRNEQFVKSALEGLFIDLLVSEIGKGKKAEIIGRLKKHLE